jgi:hypothetical protein
MWAFFKGSTLFILGDAMFSVQDVVERKIGEALKKGEFDDLPGKGRPMDLQDDSHIPEDLRLAYKILKNGDCLPPEIEEKKKIQQMEDLLEGIKDEKEKYKLIKRINFNIMKLNLTRKVSPLFEEKQLYYKKVLEKMGRD